MAAAVTNRQRRVPVQRARMVRAAGRALTAVGRPDGAVEIDVVKTYWGVHTTKYMCPVGDQNVEFEIPYFEPSGIPVAGEEATFEPTTKSWSNRQPWPFEMRPQY